MHPTTPIGSRTISEFPICSSHATSEATCAIEPKSMAGRPAWIVRARASGMPTSAEIRAAISSPRSASAALIAVQASTRCSTGTSRHASKPARAAATALSMSSDVPSGIRPITCSVVESITSMVSEPDGSTHSPPM
jgi:hypothetical protein